jgi:CheY-like chemotaxis protein
MASLLLIHWNEPEGRERARWLASLGHDAAYDGDDPQRLSRAIRASQPDAYVIDLSRLPSHGREIAMALRTRKSTRYIPIVFVGGDPDKVEKLEALLPDATYTTWGRFGTALRKALARPLREPVVPPSSIYTGKPLVEKLGIRANMSVCVIGGASEAKRLLKPLPSKVRLTADARAGCDLYLLFVRSRGDFVLQLGQLARIVTRQTVWAIWPKQTSKVRTDLNGNIIREAGLGSGWVDFKVCSVDETWSGLAFKRRT